MFHRQQRQISQKGNKPLEKQEQRTHTTAPQVNGMHPATVIQRAKDDPSSLSADEVLTLQSAIGNREVSRLLAGRSTTKVQAKLTIGQPGDKYEQEADRVASQVVEQIHAPASAQPTQGQSVQRQEESEEEIQAKPSISDLQRSPLSPQVQREAMPEEDELQAKSILQRQEEIAEGEASTDLDTAINRARGGGQPLEAGLQRSMGQAMGADFSGVKVHTDGQSDQLNQSIEAKAFTTGQDVFFRQAEYNPGSRGGQELIAHELTHVLQQNALLNHGVTKNSGKMLQRNGLPKKELERYEEIRERANSKPNVGIKPPGGKGRELKDVLQLGPSILQEIEEERPSATNRLVLYKGTKDSDMQIAWKIIEWWQRIAGVTGKPFFEGVPKRNDNLTEEERKQALKALSEDVKKNGLVIPIAGHVGDYDAAAYYAGASGVVLAFTLKAGAKEVMFRSKYMALAGKNGKYADFAKEYSNEPGSFESASSNEGQKSGYIGIKAEERGVGYSLGVGGLSQGGIPSHASQLLFQLFVEDVRVVKERDRNDTVAASRIKSIEELRRNAHPSA